MEGLLLRISVFEYDIIKMYRNRGLQGATNLTETDVWQSGKGGGFFNKGGHGKNLFHVLLK